MRTWQGLSSFTNYTGLLKSYNSFAWETTWNVTSFTVLIFPSSELASSSWTEQSFRPVLWSGSTISSERFDLIKQFVYKLDIISWYIKKWIYEYFVDISIFPLTNSNLSIKSYLFILYRPSSLLLAFMLKSVPFIKTNKKIFQNSPFVIGQNFEFWLKFTFRKLNGQQHCPSVVT